MPFIPSKCSFIPNKQKIDVYRHEIIYTLPPIKITGGDVMYGYSSFKFLFCIIVFIVCIIVLIAKRKTFENGITVPLIWLFIFTGVSIALMVLK